MKNIITAVLLFSAMFITAFAQPKLEIIGGDTYDWGEVKPKDSPLEAKIKIKNSGNNDTLKIYSVKPGCGCTTAPLDKKNLAPNETATMDVKLNVANYHNNVSKSIRITSNDPDNRTKYLRLKCYVKHDIEMMPRFINYSNVTVGEEATGKVVIKNNSDNPIKIAQIRPTLEGISLNLGKDDVIPAKGKITLEAKYTPQQKGNFRGYITIKTDNEDNPLIKINIYGGAREPKGSKASSKDK